MGLLVVLVLASALVTVHSHGSMYEPPSRNSHGMSLLAPTCAGGACQWYSQGCTIGCETASGGFESTGCDCEQCTEPRLKWGEDDHLLQYHTDGHTPAVPTTYFPWRYPGSAPVLDSCGVTGGGMPPLGQLDPPPGVPAGAKGSDETVIPKLLEETVWIQGSEVEVAWGLAANHGGGYQYRLCPAGETLNEACFQKIPLDFVGDKQWLQFGDGYDTNKRIEIDASRVSGDKVVPAGSTWTQAPIPGCIINGAREKKDCYAPTFPPPVANQTFSYSKPSNLYGIFGYGGGHCMGNQSVNPDVKCTDAEYKDSVFDFGIVDKVKVPDDLAPGDYVIGFRWDCEQTKQIWQSCGDIHVKAKGQDHRGTKAFAAQKGCSACCQEHGMCTRCRDCLTNKTGDCAYCWTPQEWWGDIRSWSPRSSHIQCLGFEGADGGAGSYAVGDPISSWSPGCSKCWSEADGCEMHVRELEAAPAPVVPTPVPTPTPTPVPTPTPNSPKILPNNSDKNMGDISSNSHGHTAAVVAVVCVGFIGMLFVLVGVARYTMMQRKTGSTGGARRNVLGRGAGMSLIESSGTGEYQAPSLTDPDL